LDHINGNRSDNRLCNLRECDSSQNKQNLGISPKGASWLIGTSWNRRQRQWTAQIKIGGQRFHLGVFDNAADAHTAYLNAKATLHTFNPTLRVGQ
jgi:hypothetical protein